MASLPAGYPTDAIEAFGFLKSRSTLSIQDLEVLAMIETWGEGFYECLARGVQDQEAKTLLLRNGSEERGHAHRILKAIKLKGGNFELPSAADNPFMQQALSEVPANSELLAMLQQGEIDGDLQYQQWADSENNPEVAELYRLNGREETRHSERVQQVKQKLGIN